MLPETASATVGRAPAEVEPAAGVAGALGRGAGGDGVRPDMAQEPTWVGAPLRGSPANWVGDPLRGPRRTGSGIRFAVPGELGRGSASRSPANWVGDPLRGPRRTGSGIRFAVP